MPDFPPQPTHGAPIVEWALWCAAVGKITGAWRVFPCWPGEKSPRRNGWQQAATCDAKTIAAEWSNEPRANVGLAIQSGFLVIDGDLYKPGKQALLDAYEAQHGALPDTMELRSARGGVHLIYRTERNLGNGKGNLPNFGDVRGHGGLIVGPGSWFEGSRYMPEHLDMPVALPAAVEGLLRERASRDPAARMLPQHVMLDDPANVQAYVQWLRTDAETWADGSGKGNNTLAATGAMGSSYALSDATTLECMAEHWNPRLDPPWQEEALERHGMSGYRSASSKFGNMAAKNPQLLFSPVVPTVAATEGEGIFHRMGAIGVPVPARQWAAGDDADGWVPLGGLTFLYGPDGVGKTALAGQWAIAQARGEPLFGLIPVRKMPVLFVTCEDDTDELLRRFAAQGARVDDDITFASFLGKDTMLHPSFKRGGTDDTPFFQLLDEQLSSMPAGDKLLILDNLAQIYQGNYFEPSDIAMFLNGYLRRLGTAHQATILVLAHPSESAKSSGAGSYGGIGWSGGVRSRLYFERRTFRGSKKSDTPLPMGEQRLLSRKKANYAKIHAEGEGVVLEWKNWVFVPATEAGATRNERTVAAPRMKMEDHTMTDGARLRVPFDIVKAAVTQVLCEIEMETFSGDALSVKVSALLGENGHEVAAKTIRTNYLPRLVSSGYAGFDRHASPVRWHYTKALDTATKRG